MRFARAAAALMLTCVAPAAAQTVAEEVRYPADAGAMLAGTLETPRAVRAGPAPVVVIIAGTGPWTRGGRKAMRARLHATGIATLMYDKRGQGRSTGAFTDTIPETERDVAAAVAFLRARPDVDGRRVALMGVSQGAVAAPLVAARDPAVAAVVMLSGPVGPRGEMFLGILRGHLRGAGKTPEQIGRVTGAVAAWMEARGARAADAGRLRAAAVEAFADAGFARAQADGFVATLDNDVVQSMYAVAPDRALAALRAPVLAVYGSKDDVIAPGLSLEAATAALGGHPDALVMMVPGMGHELQRTGAPAGEGATPEDGTMPVVIEIVGDWLAKRLIGPGRGPAPEASHGGP